MEELLLDSPLPGATRARVRAFVVALKRREIIGSYPVAKQTAEVLREVLSTHRWINAKHAIEALKLVGRVLMDARPVELGIGNVVRRVLFFVREAYFVCVKRVELSGDDDVENQVVSHAPALTNLLQAADDDIDYSHPFKIKSAVLEEINQLIQELATTYHNVSQQALDHIHASEVIMTYGASVTVEAFLSEVARKGRSFQVIVAEAAPSMRGRSMVASLSKAGIDTTLISDAAIFAMMGRVNKVIVGTHAVLANGGLVAPAGLHVVAQAAKYHSVPVVVCAGLYKLSPLYPRSQDSFNELNSPSEILSFEQVDRITRAGSGDPAFSGNGCCEGQVDVQNPSFDYIPPELVSLFVTNEGAHNPSYVYRLLADTYYPEDYTITLPVEASDESRSSAE